MAAHALSELDRDSDQHSAEGDASARWLTLDDIVGKTQPMEHVYELVDRALHSSAPLLIEGERGVGKEALARAIHAAGARRNRPYVAVACGAGDEPGIASTLFGRDPRKVGGKVGAARGGTLFLEDVSALPEGVVERLKRIVIAAPGYDIRLIAADRSAIGVAPTAGSSRSAFAGLDALRVSLLPLRERRADIPALAQRLLGRLGIEGSGPGAGEISSEALALLAAQSWPGNIRDLEHALLKAVMLNEGGVLMPQDFPDFLADRTPPATGDGISAHALRLPVADRKHTIFEGEPGADTPARWRYGVARLLDERGEMRPIGQLEEEVIRFAIGHYRGQMSEVARRLGIGRSTLYRKIRDYGIGAGETAAL